MKALLLLLALYGLPANAKYSHSCEDDLLPIFLSSDLEINHLEQVYWRGLFVNLAQRPKINGDYLFRTLLFLANHPGERIESEQLKNEVLEGMPADSSFPGVGLLTQKLTTRFRKVDPTFEMIHVINKRSFVWGEPLARESTIEGHSVINKKMRSWTWKGRPVEFTPGQYRVALLLFRSKSKGLTYERLLAAFRDLPVKDVLQDVDAHANLLRVVLSQIRSAFRKVDPSFDAIKNCGSNCFAWSDQE